MVIWLWLGLPGGGIIPHLPNSPSLECMETPAWEGDVTQVYPNAMTVYTEETTAGRAVLFKKVDLAIGFCSELTFRPWHRAVSCTSPQQWLGYLKTHDKCCPTSPGFSLLFQQ